MSSIAHRYADFSSLGPDGSGEGVVATDHSEEQKLQAFEEGYQAGWTDAEKNHTEERKSLGAEIVHTLHDLAFTYQEALSRLNKGLKPMFEQMMTTLLPQTAAPMLRAHVVEQLMQIAGTQTAGIIGLRVSEEDFALFEDLLDEVEPHLAVSLRADETLTANQVFLQLETLEREINLDAVQTEIIAAMNAFNFQNHAEKAHD
ncbi:hypothetical protein [uncultured Sulfitobacter sp.]|uniref:FliH/SctL family protein n=1 Tax=uncultured Sulfitobacter sp. TaxID=191468 RepID=UPI0026153C47|nr:hypothetical protein [uncultured Sulfitobacter sp.]